MGERMGELSQQFSALAEIYERFQQIRNRDDAQRKQDLVANRRRFAEQVGALEDILLTGGAKAVDRSITNECHKRLSRLRTITAYHQASWPAVKIDEDPEGYRASSNATHSAFHDFLQWGREQFPETYT